MGSQKKSFIISIVTISSLMLFSYLLTLFLPCNGIALYRAILSPVLALNSSSGSTTIAIIIFLLIIGGITNGLNKCGFMNYMLNKITYKYAKQRYQLMLVMVLFLMVMGSVVGTFEEIVPITPIIVKLAIDMGFDELIGLSISLLAAGCGFAAGVFNPFTVGVAQELAGLPMFSGVSLRIFSFVVIYILLTTFIVLHARKIDKKIDFEKQNEFVRDENMERAYKSFLIIFSIAIIIVLCSPIITAIQDYTLIIVALMFLIAGLTSMVKTKISKKQIWIYFKEGAIDILPSALLVLMASSIKFILDESGVLNVLLSDISTIASNLNKVELIIFIYLLCLILEIFVPSGSAKAFLLMPILIPIGNTFNISAQLSVLAYAFGDGFSNVFYPTNPALIISLGLTNVEYKKWFKYSGVFQLLNLLLTTAILLFGLVIGY